MEKIYPSVGDVISPVVPKATLSASIELSYDDLKEISKAFSRVNKALDKKMNKWDRILAFLKKRSLEMWLIHLHHLGVLLGSL